MSFSKIKTVLRVHVEKTLDSNAHAYKVDLDRDRLWEIYLSNFAPKDNELYAVRGEHDCNQCRRFIKDIGNVVTIAEDNKIVTMWDIAHDDPVYGKSFKAMSRFVKAHAVTNIFKTKSPSIGTDFNMSMDEDGTSRRWAHFYAQVPRQHQARSSSSIDTIMNNFRTTKEVFKRSMSELSSSATEVVIELIKQNSIYRGEEWLSNLERFLLLQNTYLNTSDNLKDNYCWRTATEVGPIVGRIKNHSIGTLLTDITNGVAVDEAVRRYESIVAPSNYKRPKPIFTKKMLEDAKAKVEELGFTKSLRRRFATIDDITINNVLFADRTSTKRMTGEDIFDELDKTLQTDVKKFDRATEITIDKFVSEVLPTATKVEVLVEPRHTSNVVSLIAPAHVDSKTMFKWGNNFSWAYGGNVTDSMKERVKAAGGNVIGVLRFSIQWNEDGDNPNDFDAHCIQPNGSHIFYANRHVDLSSTGKLDVDIIHPTKEVAVENIIFTDATYMPEGVYDFYINVFSYRGGKSGVRAQIEFDGIIHNYDLNPAIVTNSKIQIAKVRYTKSNGFEMVESEANTSSSKKIAGVTSGVLHPVTMCMMSPNYWDGNATGNKHYFFMIQGCKNDECPNGFFNEYLTSELLEHKRVFAALGNSMAVEPSDNQLTGLGFSSTKRDYVNVVVHGHTKRMMKVII